LLYSRAVVAVFFITERILPELFARYFGTFAAMDKAFVLTAHGNRTFAVKRVSVCFDTTAAVMTFFITTV
jgi:hypothetical protein